MKATLTEACNSFLWNINRSFQGLSYYSSHWHCGYIKFLQNAYEMRLYTQLSTSTEVQKSDEVGLNAWTEKKHTSLGKSKTSVITHTLKVLKPDIIQLLKRMKWCHLQQHGWTWRLSYWVKSDIEKYRMISFTCKIF